MAGFLQKVANVVSPLPYAYRKMRKQRAEDIQTKKAVKKGQEMAIKKEKLAMPSYKAGAKELERQIKGKGEGPATHLRDIQERFQRAAQGAEKFYEPIKQQALADFRQSTQPELVNRFGRQSGSGSSALNQALAAAQSNLSRGLAADFAGFQTNLAQNLLSQSQQAKLAAQQQRYAAATQGIGQPSAYIPPTIAPPTSLQRFGPLGAGIAGGVAGGIAGGPGGAVQGYQLGSQAGQTLFG